MARFLVFQEGDARARGLTDNAKVADALAKELSRIHGARFYVKRKPDRHSTSFQHSKGEKKMARKKTHGRKKKGTKTSARHRSHPSRHRMVVHSKVAHPHNEGHAAPRRRRSKKRTHHSAAHHAPVHHAPVHPLSESVHPVHARAGHHHAADHRRHHQRPHGLLLSNDLSPRGIQRMCFARKLGIAVR